MPESVETRTRSHAAAQRHLYDARYDADYMTDFGLC
jgi:hypothetical protein